MLSIVIVDSIPFLWDRNGVCMLFRRPDCMLRIVMGESFVGISNCVNCSRCQCTRIAFTLRLQSVLGLRVLRNDKIIQVWGASGEGGRGQSECGKQEAGPPTHTHSLCFSVFLNSNVFIWKKSHQNNSYQST